MKKFFYLLIISVIFLSVQINIVPLMASSPGTSPSLIQNDSCDGRNPCSGSCTDEGDNGTYEGTCGLLGVQNPACICIPNDPTPSPTPAQKPQPPILIKTK